MWVKNLGTAVALPADGIGVKQDGEWFLVTDELGANLIKQERFVECDENGVEGTPAPAEPEPIARSSRRQSTEPETTPAEPTSGATEEAGGTTS